jgi:hypothetical protein
MAKKETLLERDREEWLELCKWIEINIFNYDITKKQRLQKSACCVLEGLRKGQDIANNEDVTYGEYPLNIILMTFKANKTNILNAIRNKQFKNESSKMLYVCAIVRDQLNDVYSRYLNAQKTKEKVEIVDTSIMEHEGAEYQATTTKKANRRLEDLW